MKKNQKMFVGDINNQKDVEKGILDQELFIILQDWQTDACKKASKTL